jgi:hypothetical protein
MDAALAAGKLIFPASAIERGASRRPVVLWKFHIRAHAAFFSAFFLPDPQRFMHATAYIMRDREAPEKQE